MLNLLLIIIHGMAAMAEIKLNKLYMRVSYIINTINTTQLGYL
jgi:hypothetical protein